MLETPVFERLVGPHEVAEMASVDTATVLRWAREQVLPEPYRLTSRIVRWSPSEIREWLSNRQSALPLDRQSEQQSEAQEAI